MPIRQPPWESLPVPGVTRPGQFGPIRRVFDPRMACFTFTMSLTGIPSVIATSREQGMLLMDTDLLRLAREGAISVDEAYARAINKKDFEALVTDRGPAPPTAVP